MLKKWARILLSEDSENLEDVAATEFSFVLIANSAGNLLVRWPQARPLA